MNVHKYILLLAAILLTLFLIFYLPEITETYRFAKYSETILNMDIISRCIDSQTTIPNSLNDLIGKEHHPGGRISNKNLIDRITGKRFIYMVKNSQWYLVSPGPDKIVQFNDHDRIIQYDPSNGTVSEGDWIFTQQFHPNIGMHEYDNPMREGQWERGINGWERKEAAKKQ
ncbi:MAG: hypothetical protein NTX50_12465 [Candidatus Sumerlaeota bacterium]|nr:hypothetical protein [Candidatus Sumerlaeota bacterium]